MCRAPRHFSMHKKLVEITAFLRPVLCLLSCNAAHLPPCALRTSGHHTFDHRLCKEENERQQARASRGCSGRTGDGDGDERRSRRSQVAVNYSQGSAVGLARLEFVTDAVQLVLEQLVRCARRQSGSGLGNVMHEGVRALADGIIVGVAAVAMESPSKFTQFCLSVFAQPATCRVEGLDVPLQGTSGGLGVTVTVKDVLLTLDYILVGPAESLVVVHGLGAYFLEELVGDSIGAEDFAQASRHVRHPGLAVAAARG